MPVKTLQGFIMLQKLFLQDSQSSGSVFAMDQSFFQNLYPKGTVLVECGKLLQRAGYRIKVLNTINFKKSMHYLSLIHISFEKLVYRLKLSFYDL